MNTPTEVTMKVAGMNYSIKAEAQYTVLRYWPVEGGQVASIIFDSPDDMINLIDLMRAYISSPRR